MIYISQNFNDRRPHKRKGRAMDRPALTTALLWGEKHNGWRGLENNVCRVTELQH
jgi:hypothetical protein